MTIPIFQYRETLIGEPVVTSSGFPSPADRHRPGINMPELTLIHIMTTITPAVYFNGVHAIFQQCHDRDSAVLLTK